MVESAGAIDSGITPPASAAAAVVAAAAAAAAAPPAPPPSPAKKRRGRPRKSDALQQQHDLGNKKLRRSNKQQQQQQQALVSPPPVSSSLVGQPVHGVLDGSFDAGYILTVRVAQSDTILRGVVFGPGLCVPITRANDIAPNVKFTGRTFPAAAAPAPPPAPFIKLPPHFTSNPSANPAALALHLSNGSSL